MLQDCFTALSGAAQNGYVDIVQMLVDYGVAVDLRSRVTFYKSMGEVYGIYPTGDREENTAL